MRENDDIAAIGALRTVHRTARRAFALATLLTLALLTFAVPVLATERTITQEPARELPVRVDSDNPPLSQNRIGVPPGFDVEIGQAIAERLELRPRLVWADTTYGGKVLDRVFMRHNRE